MTEISNNETICSSNVNFSEVNVVVDKVKSEVNKALVEYQSNVDTLSKIDDPIYTLGIKIYNSSDKIIDTCLSQDGVIVVRFIEYVKFSCKELSARLKKLFFTFLYIFSEIIIILILSKNLDIIHVSTKALDWGSVAYNSLFFSIVGFVLIGSNYIAGSTTKDRLNLDLRLFRYIKNENKEYLAKCKPEIIPTLLKYSKQYLLRGDYNKKGFGNESGYELDGQIERDLVIIKNLVKPLRNEYQSDYLTTIRNKV